MAQAILMGVVSKGHPAGLILWEGRDRASGSSCAESVPRELRTRDSKGFGGIQEY